MPELSRREQRRVEILQQLRVAVGCRGWPGRRVPYQNPGTPLRVLKPGFLIPKRSQDSVLRLIPLIPLMELRRIYSVSASVLRWCGRQRT